jgi:N-acetylglucosamine malate deacetylase 1
MKQPSRRDVLKELGVGAAAFSIPSHQAWPQSSHSEAEGTSESSTVMAIAAHPGDAVFTMGAAVARHIKAGGRGIIFSLTHGERGNPAIAPERYGALQVDATQKAAKMLGGEAIFLSYPDGELPDNQEARLAVCDAIRQYQPAVVITHWKGSFHKDHRACYHIVEDAVFYAGLPGIERQRGAHSVSKLLFADNWEDAEGFRQDLYLDISGVFDAWVEACAAFPMWRGETGFRYDDYYQSLAVVRGSLANIGQKASGRFKYAVALMSQSHDSAVRVETLFSP